MNFLARRRRGTETIEWGLVLALIVVGAIAAITLLGGTVTDYYSRCSHAIGDAAPGSESDGDDHQNQGDNGNHGNGNNGNHNGAENGDAGGNGNGNGNGKGKK